ncbi:MAG: thiamine phosphate synthase [Candidatus Thermoplasmatota archaeon]|nr:thiamine phosphate synthase [Euryarchaeota archaeon]MBU4031445.1 thiamine phosphate synthase [Candidatus Thermoplasmatota archaeon]MBU4071956.1 thiamine phosphate synthase [Candidatus Thermoplasmatota archaeon]MBU4143642.1 thiamine phosphate synthase [Candidatus Thermoplasmatota archaeon]MBU4591302.1 thiamine phosphate synthase [Candidatus Thermoplasmatota archaeon]
MPDNFRGFYFITDSGLTKQGAVKDVQDAIRGGASVVQYREKNKSYREMLAEAKELLELCRNSDVFFIINDSVELALDIGADGIHLGPNDMAPAEARKVFPHGILGVSCGSVEKVTIAEKAGADYVAASPVFFTATKSDIGQPLGLEGIAAFRRTTGLPIVAIGGINLDNVHDVVLAGADMVCAISATVGTVDVENSVRKFVDAVSSASEKSP